MPSALPALRRALELNPMELDAVHGMVALDQAEGRRRSEAFARLRTLLDRAPKDAGLLMIAGRANLITGNLDEAEALLRRATEADPNTFDAYSDLGQVYLRKGRLDDARRSYERRVARETRPVEALTMVALIHQMQNHVDEARRTFEQVLVYDPKALVAANNLAWIYAEQGGNLDVALQLAQTASAAAPESGEVADTLGWIYLKKELYPLAIKTLERAVALDPKKPGIHYHLGLAYAQAAMPDGPGECSRRRCGCSPISRGLQTPGAF